MAEVRIEHVFKRFGAVTAVNDFDLVVKDGEFVSILGPSGCGKTTTLRILAGFERATEGEIYIGDHCVSSSIKGSFAPPEKRDIGMVFQSYALYPHLKVIDNIAFPLKQKGVSKEERHKKAREMAVMHQIEHLLDRKPTLLSGGQQQRVAMCRALVKEPKILLLDEPMSNLDARLKIEIREVIKKIQQELKVTSIIVTHDQEEAMAVSDRIAIFYAGHLQQVASPAAIYFSPANRFTAEFKGSCNIHETA